MPIMPGTTLRPGHFRISEYSGGNEIKYKVVETVDPPDIRWVVGGGGLAGGDYNSWTIIHYMNYAIRREAILF